MFNKLWNIIAERAIWTSWEEKGFKESAATST